MMRGLKGGVARDFASAALTYDQHAEAQQRIASALLDRITPDERQLYLDLGSGPGTLAKLVAARSWQVRFVQTDLAVPMCRQAMTLSPAVCADVQALPYADACFDVALSSLCLQWVDRPAAFFSEACRVLRPGGALYLATLGPDSLPELAQAYRSIGRPPKLQSLPPPNEIHDLARLAGFGGIVCERTSLTVPYPDAVAYLRHFRRIGAQYKGGEAPLSTGETRRLIAAYPSCPEGGVKATYDVIWLTASRGATNPVSGGKAR